MIFTDAQQVEQACTQNEFAGILETNKASVVRELSTSDYFELTGYTFQRGTFQDLEKESIIANIKNSIFNQNLTDRLKLISDIGLVEILDAICLNENVNQSEVIENILHEISERSISEQLEFYQYLNKGSLRTTTRVIEVLSGRNIANTFVHESINALLREEILGLADDELVARLLADPSNTHALFEVFEYLDADSSSLLLFDIHRLSKGNADTQDFLLEAWDNALQNVEIEARAEFVTLLIYNSSERNHETVVSVLESSSNLDQLCLLTNLVGVDRLLSCNSQKILELCAMSELFKGVYNDKSQGVFDGTIIVRPDAQKTNAIQSSQSLLLTDQANSYSKPQLKIWADDVKCTHGATVGQIDEQALFYLRSRGIPEKDAKQILLLAFVSEVLADIKDSDLRNIAHNLLFNKLLGR